MTAGVELAAGLASEHQEDLAGAEMSMARSLVLYRRGQAPVETANALLHLARIHRRQDHHAVASDEVEEASMLVRLCPDPGPRIQRLLSRAQALSATEVGGADRPRGTEELSAGELRVCACWRASSRSARSDANSSSR